ncbi:MAG: hypothetical protein JNL98_15835 [Bryobacterales bacterium]|nr:hypothetical protein [Bryobacterales bacterium]
MPATRFWLRTLSDGQALIDKPATTQPGGHSGQRTPLEVWISNDGMATRSRPMCSIAANPMVAVRQGNFAWATTSNSLIPKPSNIKVSFPWRSTTTGTTWSSWLEPRVKLTRRSLRSASATLAGCASRRRVLMIAVNDLRQRLRCNGDTVARTSHIPGPDTIGGYERCTSFRARVPDAVTLPRIFLNHGCHAAKIAKVFHGNGIMNNGRRWSLGERLHFVVKRDQYVLPGGRWKPGAPACRRLVRRPGQRKETTL